MPVDKGWHRKIRRKVLKRLKEEGYQPISSHTKEGSGEISLFIRDINRGEYLAQPDIVVPYRKHKDHIEYIIEIEDRAPTPKKLLGIISAVRLSNTCKKKERTLALKNTKLIIIMNDKAVDGKGDMVPWKQSQVLKLGKLAREKLLGDSLNDLVIYSEREFFDYLNIDEIFE